MTIPLSSISHSGPQHDHARSTSEPSDDSRLHDLATPSERVRDPARRRARRPHVASHKLARGDRLVEDLHRPDAVRERPDDGLAERPVARLAHGDRVRAGRERVDRDGRLLAY